MSTLNPTLQGAIAKAERGIAFLKIPQATSDHLRSAMDHFKSATRLAGSHFTVLVELEDQVPEPGVPLFDETGAPTAETQGDATGIGLRIDEHPCLSLEEGAYREYNMRRRESLEEELLFALRLHTRARDLDYDKIRDLVMDELGGFDELVYQWVVGQILTCGAFEWPHRCEDCQCAENPSSDGTVLCWNCKRKREQAALAKAKKEEKKLAKARTKTAPKNPLAEDDEDGGEA